MNVFSRSWSLFKSSWSIVRSEPSLLWFPVLSALFVIVVSAILFALLGGIIAFNPGLQQTIVDAAQSGLDLAIQLDDEITRTDFPVFYTKRLPSGAIYEIDQSRVYHTRDPDKNVYGAYRMVMSVLEDDGTHYFGLQGIRGWTDPPILEAPHDELEMDDRTFQVYPEGDRIRLVSWTEDDNVYWISNSLLLTLDNEQMLGMARSTRAFTPDK